MANAGSIVRKNLRDLSNSMEMRELNRQLDWMWKKILGGLTSKDFSDGGMRSVVEVVEETIASEITADEVTTNILKTALAEMMVAKIGVAKIDYAQIVDMFSERIFTDEGLAGEFRMDKLKVYQAQIVDLIVSSFRLVSDDGKVYKVSVDKDGNLVTEYLEDQDTWLNDGEVPDGYSAVISDLTVGEVTASKLYVAGAADVMKLTAKMLAVDQAFINELTSTDIFASFLMANAVFVNLLCTQKIVGDKSITMIAGEAEEAKEAVDNLDRLTDIEVIEGTFVQAERREGEGIHIFSEFWPKQDLTWGDPYPAGGGKNLLPQRNVDGTINGITYTRNADGSIEISGTATANSVCYLVDPAEGFVLPAGAYTASMGGALPSSGVSIICEYYNGSTWGGNYGNVFIPSGKLTFETVENTNFSMYVHVASGTTVDFTIYPQIEAGDTATGYAPYENVCPIGGHTAARLTHCGKQLCNLPDVAEATHSGIVWNCENGVVKAKGTATADEYSASAGVYYDLPVIAGQYYISGSSGNLLVYAIVRPAGSTISKIYTNKAFTLDGTESRVRICCFVASGETVDATVYPMLVTGEAELLWEPYQGDTYTLDFGETIYGGTMNWQTGELAVDWKMVSLTGEESWVYYSDATYPYWYMSIDALGSVVNSADDVCSHFQNVNISSASDNTGFSVYNPSAGNYARLGIRPKIDGVNDLDTFKAYLATQYAAGTPVQIAYKLVEPYTIIKLTPVQITTLKGLNTVYTDADGGRVEFGHDPLANTVDALEGTVKDVQATANDALPRVDFQRVVRIDDEGLHVGDNQSSGEVLIDSASMNIVLNGTKYSSFTSNFVQFGNYQLRKTADGGLAFKLR